MAKFICNPPLLYGLVCKTYSCIWGGGGGVPDFISILFCHLSLLVCGETICMVFTLGFEFGYRVQDLIKFIKYFIIDSNKFL